MNCIIADDEPLARKGMERMVGEIPFLHLVATCCNAVQVMDAVQEHAVDLLFLDIEMPRMSGIDLLKSIRKMPITIITTAFPEYALISYELEVVDYLVKPIPLERFLKAVNRARDFYELQHGKGAREPDDFVFIKCEHRYEKVYFDQILYIEALQNYVVIHTTHKRLISYLTMKSVEDYLPASRFIKVNKSHIIPVDKVESVTGNTVKVGAHTFSLGRAHKDEILERILNNKVLRRNG